MSEFQKQVYTDMSTTDRILLWMVKAQELSEFGKLMIELGDMPALKRTLDTLKDNSKSASKKEGDCA